MLKSIRKNMKPIMWITALAFIATIFFSWGMHITSKAMTNVTVAKVNGDAIKKDEFNYALINLERNYRKTYGDRFDKIKEDLNLESQVLNQLIDQRLLMQEIKKQRIKVSDREIIYRIKQDPIFKDKKGEFDKAKFEQYVNNIPASQWKRIENGIRKSLSIEHLWRKVTDPVLIGDKEIFDEFLLKNEKVKIKHICFCVNEFKNQVSVKDEEIAEYFAKNKAEFKQPDRVNVEYILIEDEGRAYDVSIDLSGDDKWEEILKIENLSSKKTGYFAEIEKVPDIGYSREFAQSAFSLSKNDISDPIKTAKGFCILRLLDLKPSYIPDHVEEIKEDVRERLMALKAEKLAKKKANEFIEKLQSMKNMEKLAKKLDYEVKQTDFFERGVYVKDIGYAPKLIAEAFLLKKDDVKEVSEFQNIFIIELVERKDANKEEFDTQKEEIKQTLLQKKRQLVYEKWFKNLKQEAKIVNNLDKIRRAK